MAKNLRTYLDTLRESRPDELKRVSREVDPIFEVTALLEKLQQRNQFPAVLFTNVKGSRLPLLINLHASFERMALALGARDLYDMEMHHAERESHPLALK